MIIRRVAPLCVLCKAVIEERSGITSRPDLLLHSLLMPSRRQHYFYDFKVWSKQKRIKKLHYMHDNPVKRGLVLEPEQWAWSSIVGIGTGKRAWLCSTIFP
jgi:hypothetical protein